MKKLFCMGAALVMLAGSAATVKAEGYNRIGISYDLEIMSPNFGDNTNLNGFGVGYLHGFQITQMPLYIETGLNMTAGFWSEKEQGIKSSLTKLTFNVPVNVGYRFYFAGDTMNLMPYLGLNLKVNAMADRKVGDGDSYSLFKEPYKASYVQVGWHIGAVYNFSCFYAGLSYGTDFNRFVSNDGLKISTMNFNVSAGYQF